MIVLVVYSRHECDVAKARLNEYDIVIFIQEPNFAVAYALFKHADDALKTVRSRAYETYLHKGFLRIWHPYDAIEFFYPLDEDSLLNLLKEVVLNVRIEKWGKPMVKGQLIFRLCSSCRENNENCKICTSKIIPR